jgi:purine nucleoside permease
MKIAHRATFLSVAVTLVAESFAWPFQARVAVPSLDLKKRWDDTIKPKIVIISMFPPEAGVWYGIPDFNVLAHNITVPGLSPLFPDVHCTEDADVCQVTLGESGS